MLCRAASKLFRVCQVPFDDVSYSRIEVDHARFGRRTLLNHEKCTPSSQLSSSIAQQRRQVPCLALRWCCELLRCTHCISNTQYQASCDTRLYQPPRPVGTCVLSFRFLHLIVQSRSSCFFFLPINDTRVGYIVLPAELSYVVTLLVI